MPMYRYKATGSDGLPNSGRIDAADEASARETLAAQGIQVQSLTLEGESADDSGRTEAPQSREDLSGSSSSGVRLRADEQVEVFDQIGSVVRAELPLSIGLRTLAEEVPSDRMRIALTSLSDKLEAGEDLAVIAGPETAHLPEWLVVMLQSGTQSGKLAESVEHFVRLSRLRIALKSRILMCLCYPALLVASGVIVSAVILLMVTPTLSNMFYDFGMDLPPPTRILLAVGSVVVGYISMIEISAPITAFVFVSAYVALYLIMGRSGLRRLLYEIPLIGKLIELSSLVEFCQLLALLVDNRIPLDRAFELAASGIRDPNLSDCARQTAMSLQEGKSLTAAAAEIRHFPVELRRVPGWDDPDEKFPRGLRSTAEVIAVQCEVRARSLIGFLTPVTVLAIAAMVAFTVVAAFLPLVGLLGALT